MVFVLGLFCFCLTPANASAQQSCSERSRGQDRITCTFVPSETGTFALTATTSAHSFGQNLWISLTLTVSHQQCGYKETNWRGTFPVQIKTSCQATLEQGKTYILNAIQQNKGGKADSIDVEISFQGSGGAAPPIASGE